MEFKKFLADVVCVFKMLCDVVVVNLLKIKSWAVMGVVFKGLSLKRTLCNTILLYIQPKAL